jgi:hypothetical protein
MKTYEITVKHDSGNKTIRTRARNHSVAFEMVCNFENCPRSAIVTWRVVPTKQQIRKTQRLLSGI